MKVEDRMQFYVTKDGKEHSSNNSEMYLVGSPPVWDFDGGYWMGQCNRMSLTVCEHTFGFIPGYGECWWCVLSEDQLSWDCELVSVKGCEPE